MADTEICKSFITVVVNYLDMINFNMHEILYKLIFVSFKLPNDRFVKNSSKKNCTSLFIHKISLLN